MKHHRGTVAALVAALLLLGCRVASADTAGSLESDNAGPPVVVTREYAPPPTGTPYPTFTPAPTAVPVEALGLMPAPAVQAGGAGAGESEDHVNVVLSSDPSKMPAGEIPVIGNNGDAAAGPAPGASPVAPTRRPFGLIEGTKVLVEDQTMFMLRTSRMPDFWPDGRSIFFARTARHLVWWVRFDLDGVEKRAGVHLFGLMRWLRLTDDGEVVISQNPYELRDQDSLLVFYQGGSVPGHWRPGKYRVELWDHLDRAFIDWEFEVR